MSDEFRKIPRSYSKELEKSAQQGRQKVLEGITDSERDFGSGDTSKKAGSPNWIKISVIAIVLLGMTALGIVALRAKSKAAVSKAPAVVKVAEEIPQLDTSKGDWKGGTPQEVAEKFLAATNQQERLRWVKDPQAVAGIVEQFYQNGPGKKAKSTKLTLLPQDIASYNSHARFAVSMDDGSVRLLCVPYSEKGDGLVDFKCYALYGTATWAALLDGTATKSEEVRVIVERSNYYNGEFSDDKKWLAFVITSPDIEDVFYFYARKDDPGMERLIRDTRTDAARFTLGIESIGNSYQRRQFAITKVIRHGWLSE